MKTIKMISYLMIIILIGLIPGITVMAAENSKLHQESFSTDRELKGLYGVCEMYFQTESWDIEDANLKLYYTSSTLVREEVSDFTISINGEPIFSQRLTLLAGETQELTVSIPKRNVIDGVNTVRIESYIRTNVNDPCEEDISTASWMVIRKESNISLTYKPRAGCQNVADVYEQLTSIEGLENKKSAVFLPNKPSNEELTTASLVLAGTANNAAQFYDNLELINASSVKEMDGYKYGVYISEYEKLLPEIKKMMTVKQVEAAEKQAIIFFVQLSDTQNIIVVTGKDADSLQNAGRLFGNKEYMMQTKATWRMVSASEDVTMPVSEEITSQITETGSYVAGPFRQTAQFPIALGANKAIAPGSEVEIRFRYAQNLDFDRSMVTVYVGETPIGSKKLEKNFCNGDSLKLSIPDNLQITGPFMLNVVFDLELKNFSCEIRKQDMPWAYVSNESYIRLATEAVPWLLFEYYPSPFIFEGKMNQVVCVLPAKETKTDMEVLRKIMLTLGRYQTNNRGSLRVCRADNMGELKESNVISIGILASNPIAQQLNDQLYFQFSSKGTTIRSNEKMKIEPNYGEGLGTAQLIYSPYSSKKNALLLVSGVKEEGMLNAAEYVGNVEKSWQIYGDGYVADPELVFVYRFGPDNSKQDQTLSKLTQQSDVLFLLIVGVSVILLITLSFLMIWKKYKRR